MPARKKSPAYLPPITLLGLVIVSIIVFWIFSPNKQVAQTQPSGQEAQEHQFQADSIDLPTPSQTSRTSIEQALAARRSSRSFEQRSISLQQISQLLWAAQGITTDWGGRTSPSAKSAYPLTVYLVSVDVNGLDQGVYEYLPGDLEPTHQLGLIKAGDFTESLAAAGQQSQFQSVPAALVIAGDFQKMADAFDGERRDNNVYLEAGHVGQNVYLQAAALGLGTVTTGGFNHDKTRDLLDVPSSQTLIYMMPVGYPE